MRQKEWLYFLMDSAGNTYDVSDGDVILTPSPVPLENSPDGWMEQSARIKKSLTYFNLYREFSIKLRFVRDAAKILRYIAITKGYEENVLLSIAKLNHKTFQHELWYKGEVDLSQMDSMDDFFDVNLAEGGFAKNLKANEGTTYEIPLDGNSEIITFDGIALKQTTTSLVQGEIVSVDGFVYGNHIPETTIVSNETEKIPTSVRATEYSNFREIDEWNHAHIVGSQNYILKATTAGQLKVNANFRFKSAFFRTADFQQPYFPADGLIIKVDIRVYSSGVLTQQQTIYSSTDLGLYYDGGGGLISRNLVTHNVTGNYNLPLEVNDEVYLLVYGMPLIHDHTVGVAGSENIRFYYRDLQDISFQSGEISFSADYKFKETTARCLLASDLFAKLIDKVSEGECTGVSSILKTSGSGRFDDPFRALLITSGDGIRQLENAVVKTSLKDFFQSLNVPKNAGMGREGTEVKFEDKATFFLGSTVYDFGEVKDLHVTWANDMIFNEIEIGWPNQDYDDTNGRNEFNTTQEWKTAVKRVVNKLNLVSKYRADGYGIEFTRINLDGKRTTDSESDNNVFIIDAVGLADSTGRILWRPYREQFTSVTGVLSPETLYNIGLSPKRCLIKHSNFIRSFLYKVDKPLTFQTNSKNGNMVTTSATAGVIDERADYAPADMDAPIFLPLKLNATMSAPVNLLQLAEMTRSGRFQLRYKGVPYRGVLLDGAIKPDSMEEVEMIILASPDNDLTKLI